MPVVMELCIFSPPKGKPTCTAPLIPRYPSPDLQIVLWMYHAFPYTYASMMSCRSQTAQQEVAVNHDTTEQLQ